MSKEVKEYFIEAYTSQLSGRDVKLTRLGIGFNAKVRLYINGEAMADFTSKKAAKHYLGTLAPMPPHEPVYK